MSFSLESIHAFLINMQANLKEPSGSADAVDLTKELNSHFIGLEWTTDMVNDTMKQLGYTHSTDYFESDLWSI